MRPSPLVSSSVRNSVCAAKELVTIDARRSRVPRRRRRASPRHSTARIVQVSSIPSLRLDVPTASSAGRRVEVLPAIDPAVVIRIGFAAERPIAVEVGPLIDPSVAVLIGAQLNQPAGESRRSSAPRAACRRPLDTPATSRDRTGSAVTLSCGLMHSFALSIT